MAERTPQPVELAALGELARCCRQVQDARDWLDDVAEVLGVPDDPHLRSARHEAGVALIEAEEHLLKWLVLEATRIGPPDFREIVSRNPALGADDG